MILRTVVALALAASTASAQSVSSGTIRGKVADETGGALPGAAVSITSPALLVPQLVAVTDVQGNYSLPDLPIGEYRVSYDLTGFQRLVRENIVIAAGFSAEINVTMKVGSVQETVTVSGQSPVVDTTSTTPSTHLTGQFISETIPATRTLQEFIVTAPSLVPSQRPDTGGGANAGGSFTINGFNGQATFLIEGVNTRQDVGGGQSEGFGPDMTSLEEMQIVTVGGGAEQALPGVWANMIVKSGGNTFHGRYEAQGTNHNFQGSNLTAQLRAQGVGAGDSTISLFEPSGDVGGPIVRDRLWFYTAGRYQRANRTTLGFASDPGRDGRYNTADDVLATRLSYLNNETIKATYQAAPHYKIIGFYTRNGERFPAGFNFSRTVPLEATTELRWNPMEWKFELQGTPTSRVVFNLMLGQQYYNANYYANPQHADQPATFDNTTRISTGPEPLQIRRPRRNWEPTGSMSFYPEGSLFGRHELKAGFNVYIMTAGTQYPDDGLHGNYRLIFQTLAGVAHQPYQILTYNIPVTPKGRLNEGGGYVQDTWRPGERLTLNLGVRFDTFHAFVPETTKVQGSFGGAGTFPRVEAGSWRLFAPRLGAAFDLTGDGKTVLKATFGRYNHTPADNWSDPYNQNGLSTTTYFWHDLNRNNDYDPGEVNLSTTSPDFVTITAATNNIINRDLKNPYTRQFSLTLDRELMANFGARLNYIYFTQFDEVQTINVLRPSSYFTQAIPRVDPGPDGVTGTGDDGGEVIVWNYPSQYAGGTYVGNERMNIPDDRRPIRHTIEGVVTRRQVGKWGVLGSAGATRVRTYNAPIPTSPNSDYFNRELIWNWQAKVSGNYDFPWKLTLSGTYQAYNGIRSLRTAQFTGIPSQGTVTLRMDDLGSRNGAPKTLMNLRVARPVDLGAGRRLRLSVELLNALNAASPWAISFLSGPTFGQISNIDQPRIVRFSATLNF
jgi:outer membrane receptor protein involved in Fe transport